MAQQYKFPTTLPIDINFFNAESLSPLKLTDIFAYIKAGSYIIESYLGNGIDYNITEKHKKKAIGNISNVIGSTNGNIYMPYNMLESIYSIYRNYCSTYKHDGNDGENNFEQATYNYDEDCIVINNKQVINIPINKKLTNGGIIGIHFSTNADTNNYFNQARIQFKYFYQDNTSTHTNSLKVVSITPDSELSILNATDDNLSTISESKLPILHVSQEILENTFISYIQIQNFTDAVKLKVYGMYLCENSHRVSTNTLYSRPKYVDIYPTRQNIVTKTALNSFYNIGLYHTAKNAETIPTIYPSYCIVKPPCKWSSSAYNSLNVECSVKTLEGKCIGNTYDIYANNKDDINSRRGMPVCANSAGWSSHFDSSLKDGSYEYEEYSEMGDFILQSPLNIYPNKAYAIRYTPFAFTGFKAPPSGSITVEIDRLLIYNTTSFSSENPIVSNVSIAATDRPDILYIKKTNLTSKIAKNEQGNQFLVLGCDYGISEMLEAIFNLMFNSPKKHVAVYAY